MTNKTINALTGATVPVAGTETIPIWNGSATVKVSIANLVSASVFPGYFTTGNFSDNITQTDKTKVVSWGYQETMTNAASTASLTRSIDASGNVIDRAYKASGATYALYVHTTSDADQLAFSVAATGATGFTTGLAVGGATAGAGGIAFPATAVAVADANTLDDYEEGTWTAAFVPATSGTITLTLATGTYVKIGRAVTISGVFTVASVSSPVGYLTITGLPFAGGSGTSFRTSVSIVANGLAATMTTFLTATIQSDSNIYVFKSNGLGSLSGGAEAIQAGSEIFIGGTYQIT